MQLIWTLNKRPVNEIALSEQKFFYHSNSLNA